MGLMNMWVCYINSISCFNVLYVCNTNSSYCVTTVKDRQKLLVANDISVVNKQLVTFVLQTII